MRVLLRAGAVVLGLIVTAGASPAQVIIPPSSGDFSRFANGDLAGQNGWVPVTTTPTGVQISGGHAVMQGGLTTDLPDVRYPYTNPVPPTASASYYVGLTLRVNYVDPNQGFRDFLSSRTGDGKDAVILAAKMPSGASAPFWQPLISAGREANGSTDYIFSDRQSFNRGQTYRMILAYDFVSGAGNDVFSLYADPVSPDRAANAPLLRDSGLFSSVWPEISSTVVGLTLTPQGSSTFADTSTGVEIDRITAGTDFAAVYNFITPVPEPSSLLLAGAGFVALGMFRRRRRT